MINIKGKDKALVLSKLYNASKQQGMGFMHPRGASGMTPGEAKVELEENPTQYFDYLHGRVMKVNLSGDEFDPRLYDRDNGDGAAQRALENI